MHRLAMLKHRDRFFLKMLTAIIIVRRDVMTSRRESIARQFAGRPDTRRYVFYMFSRRFVFRAYFFRSERVSYEE